MRVLAITGTTEFTSLEDKVSELAAQNKNISLMFQKLGSERKYSNLTYVNFLRSKFYWRDFDVVITHCGAGTVFSLLKDDYPFIAIPNLDRHDVHQLELFAWLKQNNYCSCRQVGDLSHHDISILTSTSFDKFTENSEFDTDLFNSILREL